jgi:hypothetical protein
VYKSFWERRGHLPFFPGVVCRHVGTILHISAGKKGKEGASFPVSLGKKIEAKNQLKDYKNKKNTK